MRIISIDVGIRNLGICIIEHEGKNYKIIDWKNLNLCEEKILICDYMVSEKIQCKNKAKFIKNNKYFCKKHSLKTKNTLCLSDLNKYKQLKINDLIQLCKEYDILCKNPVIHTYIIKI